MARLSSAMAVACALMLGTPVVPARHAPTAHTHSGSGAGGSAMLLMLVPPTDKRLYFSEQNWAVNGSVAVAVNPGAYMRLAFTDSASVALAVVPTSGGAGAAGVPYMSLAFSVDNGERTIVPVLSNTTAIVLATGLKNDSSLARPHTVDVFIYNSRQDYNRWSDPTHARGAALLLGGVLLDPGASLVAPVLRPKRMLLFGDSITEGVQAQCHPEPGCTAGGDLCHNAATKTWGTTLAAALQAEYSQVGFGSLGWSVPGGGGVAPLFVPGDDAGSSWNKIWQHQPRSFADLDYLFVLHGTNDGLRGATADAVAASVQGWLAAVRAAVGPGTQVFLTVPFGGFGSVNVPVGALRRGFDAYQHAAPDPRTHYIDLGRPAAVGLECFHNAKYTPAYGSRCGPSEAGCGGIHPRGGTLATARHGELGAMLAVAALQAMSP